MLTRKGNGRLSNDQNPQVNQRIVFKAEFEMAEKVSTNRIYSGVHYRTRMKHKKQYIQVVKNAIKKQKLKPVTEYPVILRFTFSYQKNQLDASNGSYMAKIIEDLLVKNGILEDDRAKFVSGVELHSLKGKENKILLEVIKYESNESKRDCKTVRQPVRPFSRGATDKKESLFE